MSSSITSSTVAAIQRSPICRFPQWTHRTTSMYSGARSSTCLRRKSSSHTPSNVVPSRPHSTQNVIAAKRTGPGNITLGVSLAGHDDHLRVRLALDHEHAIFAHEPRSLRGRHRLAPDEVPDCREPELRDELLGRHPLSFVERRHVEAELPLAQRPAEEVLVASRHEDLGASSVHLHEDQGNPRSERPEGRDKARRYSRVTSRYRPSTGAYSSPSCRHFRSHASARSRASPRRSASSRISSWFAPSPVSVPPSSAMMSLSRMTCSRWEWAMPVVTMSMSSGLVSVPSDATRRSQYSMMLTARSASSTSTKTLSRARAD